MLKNLIFDDDTRAFGEIEPGKETSLLILYDTKKMHKNAIKPQKGDPPDFLTTPSRKLEKNLSKILRTLLDFQLMCIYGYKLH
jgi:hypothetical protein